jgi:ubiquinone/menaquinone biosynthesis C-methylase UbiE
MSLIETDETNLYTFEPFASHKFYTDVNRVFVKQALAHLRAQDDDTPLTILDMACGTGAVTRLVAEELIQQRHTGQIRLIGVDPSAEALRRAQKGMDELGLPATIKAEFIQGESEDLPKIVQNVDAAFFCNAIHLVPDKLAAFKLVASILAPKGIFGCNSSFYEGAYVPGTERFYRTWTRRAVGWLKQEYPEVRLSREAKAMAMQWLTPDDYIQDLKQSGFTEVETQYTDTAISLDAWNDIGHYWLFIEGALPGIPLSQGAEALGAAVYKVGAELGLQEVPRTWLQMVAIKE